MLLKVEGPKPKLKPVWPPPKYDLPTLDELEKLSEPQTDGRDSPAETETPEERRKRLLNDCRRRARRGPSGRIAVPKRGGMKQAENALPLRGTNETNVNDT